MKAIAAYHPVVLLVYFAVMLGTVMFTASPVLLWLALVGGLLAGLAGRRPGEVLKTLGIGLLFCLAVAAANPLFSQNGATPLFFLWERPITLEAICYGLQIACMLVTAMTWFACMNRVMRDDKLLYLFGRVAPRITTLLTAALRFVPRFAAQQKRIRMAGAGLGLFGGESWAERLRSNGRVFGVLVGWSLEQAVAAGSAMQARGYGLKGRSRFSLFRFTGRDAGLLVLILLAAGLCLPALLRGAVTVTFYPRLVLPPVTPAALACYIGFGILSFLPCILEGKEALAWKYYRSKI